jgi:hypothetical protein
MHVFPAAASLFAEVCAAEHKTMDRRFPTSDQHNLRIDRLHLILSPLVFADDSGHQTMMATCCKHRSAAEHCRVSGISAKISSATQQQLKHTRLCLRIQPAGTSGLQDMQHT